MEIKDLQANTGKVELTAQVTEKGEARTFEKFGKSGRVCKATLEDASGKTTLTLWNDEVDSVQVGDTIKISNGWCSEFKGEKQVSAGKFGKIEILEASQPGVLTNDPQMLQQQAALQNPEQTAETPTQESPSSTQDDEIERIEDEEEIITG